MAYKMGSHFIDHKKLKTKTSDAVNSTLTAAKASATSVFTSPFNQPVVRGYVYWNFDEDTKTLTFSMKTELSNKIGNKAQFTSYSETPWSAKCEEDKVEKVILLDKITLHYPQNWLPRRSQHYDDEGTQYYTEYEGMENLDLSQALNLDHMFENWTCIPKWVENLDVSAVTSMAHMFANASFETDTDLSSWDTSHVTDMNNMFYFADGGNVNIFTKTENVTNFEYMFASCWAKVFGVDKMNWNNGVNFKGMFSGGASLTTRTFPNVPNGKYFDWMFCDQPWYETEDKTLDLTNWDTRNMETTDNMFCWFTGPNIYIGAGWNMDNVVSSEGMFDNASNLPNYNSEKCDVSVAHVGGDGVLSYLPYKVYWAIQEEGTVLRFSKFEIDGSVKGFFMNDAPKQCPWEAQKATIQNIIFDFNLDLSDKAAGPYYLKDYFNHMPKLISFTPLNGFIFSSKNFAEALSGDIKLSAVDGANFVLQKDNDFNPYDSIKEPALSLKNMFYDCRALKSITFPSVVNNLGGIDASSMCRQSGIEEVEFGENYFLYNCENMFASSLAESIRFKFPFSQAFRAMSGYISFSYMFYNAKAVTEIDLTEAEIFHDEFGSYGRDYCTSHKLQYLFAGCSALKEIYVMDDDEYWGYFLRRDYCDHMFEGCISLRNYDPSVDPNEDYQHCHPNCSKWDEEYYDYRNLPGYLYAIDNPPADFNYWKIEDGVLYISTSTQYNPEQAIPKKSSFSADNLPPWSGNTEVTKVIIEGFKLLTLDYAFYNLPNVTQIKGLSKFKFSSPEYEQTSAAHTFEDCSSLTSISIEREESGIESPFYGHPVTSVENMCKNCESLVSFDVDGLCIYGSPDERGMVGMFQNCKKLTSCSRYSFDNWGSTDISIDYMFFNCESLTGISILAIDGAPSACHTFDGCSNLSYIGAVPEEWEISGDSTDMFRGCNNLPNFDPNHLNKEKAHRREGGYLSMM